MSLEDPGSVSFAGIGGLGEQVRELREVIELPLMNPELFEVGLAAGAVRSFLTPCTEGRNQTTQGSPALRTSRDRYVFPHPLLCVLMLLEGKTLLARAVAATLNTNFLKVVSSAVSPAQVSSGVLAET